MRYTVNSYGKSGSIYIDHYAGKNAAISMAKTMVQHGFDSYVFENCRCIWQGGPDA